MTIPETMRAIAIDEPGGPEVLIPVTEPVPGIGGNDVLVRVMAAGVNRPDVLQRQGLYPVPPDASQLPGLEIAGEVVATGESVSRWSVGDSVMALTHGGGYAEYCRVDEGHCLPVPPKLSLIEAAAVPETFFTVWYNVFMRCRLAEGETFLVHGGSSGIGTTAIQLAKAHGCTVITTAGTNDKCRFCEDLGADKAINYKAGDWQEAVMDYTDGRGVDVLLDMVRGPLHAEEPGQYGAGGPLRDHRLPAGPGGRTQHARRARQAPDDNGFDTAPAKCRGQVPDCRRGP